MKMTILTPLFAMIALCILGCCPSPKTSDLPKPIKTGEDLNHAAKLCVRAGDGTSTPYDDSSRSLFEFYQAMGYFNGFRDMTIVSQAFKAKTPYVFQKDLETTQLIRIVDKYLSAHPEKFQQPAAVIMVDALTEAYPNKSY